jgi:hypothetical protein
MRRNLRRFSLDEREDLFDQLLAPRSISGRLRGVHLASHTATSNEVQPVGTILSGHRINEGERLDSKAKAKKLFLECLETMELVAQRRGALELQTITRTLHVGSERLDRAIVRAIEEGAGELHALMVLLRGATADARAEALLHLEANAAGGSWKDAEQLRLIGIVHGLVVGAVAQA